LTADDEQDSRAPESPIYCGSLIHIARYDEKGDATDICYMVLDPEGKIGVSERALRYLGI
jgi:hypothetical protein